MRIALIQVPRAFPGTSNHVATPTIKPNAAVRGVGFSVPCRAQRGGCVGLGLTSYCRSPYPGRTKTMRHGLLAAYELNSRNFC